MIRTMSRCNWSKTKPQFLVSNHGENEGILSVTLEYTISVCSSRNHSNAVSSYRYTNKHATTTLSSREASSLPVAS